MFPARNSAEACLNTFYYSLFYCEHSSAGIKYLILLENLFGRDTNLVLLAPSQNLKKMLKL